MAIVYQHDKRSGITYAYESKSRWDKDKKQSRAVRKLIGRVDPVTKEVYPTRKRKEKVEFPVYRHLYYGATYMLDEIGRQTGVIKDLMECFPNNYREHSRYWLFISTPPSSCNLVIKRIHSESVFFPVLRVSRNREDNQI